MAINTLLNEYKPATGNEISSADAGINTLEDLLNTGSAGYSRNDPTLWSINGQKVRIDSKLYQDYAKYWQAWGNSDIYKKYGIKESGQYRDEWTKNYLANYNAGALSQTTQPTTPSQNITQPPISPQSTPTQTAWQSNFSNIFSGTSKPNNFGNMTSGWGKNPYLQAWQNTYKPKGVM